MCSEIAIMSKECLNKDKKFRKSSKCLFNEAMLRWRIARDEFLFILSLLKSLMSWYLEFIKTGWSESLKGVSMELHFVENILRFSSGKMFVSLEKRKLLQPEFMRDTSEFDWSKNGNIFDWHRKHIYGMFCFEISWYCLLFILVQSLWNRAWQVVQETWCCFVFTFLLQPSQKTFVTVNAKFK